MLQLDYFLNEQSVIDQVKYQLIPVYGESEYQKLIEANPISMLDGLLYFSITTKEKPKGTSPTSIEQRHYGWVSNYNKKYE